MRNLVGCGTRVPALGIRVRRWTRGLVLFAALGVVLTRPVATQNRESRGGIVRINGADAVAGDVLVRYHAALRDADRQHIKVQMDADRDEQVGGAGVRRVHSRRYDTETLLAFLRTDARVAYAEPLSGELQRAERGRCRGDRRQRHAGELLELRPHDG